METPQYIKNAQNKYNSKFDLVQLKLPKGTKERIKSVLQDGQSIAGYCVQCVLDALESGEIVQDAPDAMQTTEEKQKAESLDDLQALLDAKRAEIEAAKQEKEANKEQKRAETIAAAKLEE